MRKLLTFLIALSANVVAVVSPVWLRLALISLLCALPASSQAWWQSIQQVAVSGGGGGYTGPGDIVTGAKAWWGLRAYSTATRGNKAINVCNASDVTCVDFLTDATTGKLVITTVGGSDCSVVTCTIKIWYDQSGGTNCSSGTVACDLSQSTIGNRATLKVNCIGSLPCGQGAGGSAPLASTAGIFIQTFTQPYTTSVVAERTGAFTTQAGILYLNGAGGDMEFASSANTVLIYAGGSATVSGVADSAPHAFQALYNGASSNFYIDGTSNTVNPSTNNAGNQSVLMGSAGGTTLTGNWFEGGAWTGDQSATFSTMNSNQHTYWGF